MKALLRVVRAPGLIAGVWLLQILVAAGFGLIVQTSAQAALQAFSPQPDNHDLYYLAELLATQPTLVPMILGALALAAVLSQIVWTLAAPIVLARLQPGGGALSLREVGATGFAALAPTAVQTLWNWLLRAALLVLVMVVSAPLPVVLKLVLLLLAHSVSTFALDLVRVQVTLHEAARFHIRSALFAFARAFTSAPTFAACAAVGLAQILLTLAIVWLGLRAVGEGSTVWTIRALALLALVLGLWRMSLVLELGQITLKRDPDAGRDD